MSNKTGVRWLDDVEKRVKTADPAELAEKVAKAIEEAGYEPERGGNISLVRNTDGSYEAAVRIIDYRKKEFAYKAICAGHVNVPEPGAAMGVEAFHKMYLADNSLRDLFAKTAKLLNRKYKSYQDHGFPIILNAIDHALLNPAYTSGYDVTPYIPYIINYWGEDTLWKGLDPGNKEEAAMIRAAKHDYKYFCRKYGGDLGVYKTAKQLFPETYRDDFYKYFLSAEGIEQGRDEYFQRFIEKAEIPASADHT